MLATTQLTSRPLLPFIVTFFAVIVQSTWLAECRVWGAQPNLALLVTLLNGLLFNSRSGAVQGMWAGYLEGALAGARLGSFMVSRLLSGFLVGLPQKVVERDNPVVLLACAFGGTVLCEVIFFVMSPTIPPLAWLVGTLKEAAFNTALAPLLYPLLRRWLQGQQGGQTVAGNGR